MKKYEKYKDSGIEWIGEIPEGWDITRLANFGVFHKGRGVSRADLTETGVPVVLYGDIYTKYNIATTLLERRTSIDTAKGSVKIEKGDLLFTASGETKEDIGKCICFLGNEQSYAGGDVIIFRQPNNNSLFLSYIFNSFGIVIQKAKLSKGEIVVHIYSSQLRNIHFSIPPLTEQTQIANYLDHKTKQIDELIADKQNLIELLKEERTATINQAVTKGLNSNAPMKDSGIEWLGEIPECWEVKKLKYCFDIIGGYAFSSNDFKGEGVQLVKIGNLYQNKLSLDRQPTFLQESFKEVHKDYLVKRNDILLSLTGTLGKKDYGYAILVENDVELFVNQRVAKINSKNSMDIDFSINIFHSETYLNQLFSIPTGTKQGNLSCDDVLSIHMANPHINEQKTIAKYIKTIKSEIDGKISKTDHQITLLKEYKTALISEVVTGKVDVRNEVLN